ncbi:INAR1 protein, partial [Smithornis capensis]|nr:INAR1 protein [Smithornis capensis]
AQIGPPGMQLESTNGDIKIKISPPEANQEKKMWINDLLFKYNLVFWENSSNPQLRSKNVLPIDTIDDLAPETTYCFKVQANLPMDFKEGMFSPVQCMKTTTKGPHIPNSPIVSCRAFRKHLHQDYSGNWASVPSCGNVTVTRCHLSPAITNTGFYYFRVQARGDHNRSCLSKEVQVDPLETNEIGPPGIKLDSSETLLHIQISPPGGPEDEDMRDSYVLSYRILYWKNSSNEEEEAEVKETQQTVATLPGLRPGTVYCVRAQALSRGYNKSSAYSPQQCIQTLPEKTFPLIILATFVGALFVVLLVALPLVFVLYQAYSKIKYVFFPSCQPPLNIEGFGGHLSTNPYLPTVEEPVENCSIIDSMITEEGNQIAFKDYKHSKQSSRDSGNYSNDDNTSGSKGSEETPDKEML